MRVFISVSEIVEYISNLHSPTRYGVLARTEEYRIANLKECKMRRKLKLLLAMSERTQTYHVAVLWPCSELKNQTHDSMNR